MLIPLNCLKEYVDCKQTSSEIADILTRIGLEVDAVKMHQPAFSKVIVGQVLEVQQHPNADQLKIATVSDTVNTHQVVCGASNCQANTLVAFAPIGAELYVNEKRLKIKKSKLRGIESFGMLCSSEELGVFGDPNGIIILPSHFKCGTDLISYYQDEVMEISLTPNLGHCLSMIGIARELAAATQSSMTLPTFTLKESSKLSTKDVIDVNVQDKTACPRYACRYIQGVKVAPSPDWLQHHLNLIGIRSINNVVDVTNLILWEYGQPLHAFDYDLISGHKIEVKCSDKDILFTTLDNEERTIAAGALFIYDEKKPLALAGIIGGQESAVSENSTNILIESAYFQPSLIRKTSKNTALQTDSSKRFERFADPNAVIEALDKAASIIQDLAGGEIAQTAVDIKESTFVKLSLSCRVSRVHQILGVKLAVSEIETIFKNLGFTLTYDNTNTFTVTVPTYRNDLQSEIDLIEEVARMYGYDNIQVPHIKYSSSSLPHSPIYLYEKQALQLCLQEGLQEFITCDLISPSLVAQIQSTFNQDALISVLNPTSVEHSILRTSLLPGLLAAVKHNLDHKIHDISGCEIGRIHFKSDNQYTEQSMLAVILTGNNRPHFWKEPPHQVDFFDLKGIVDNLLTNLTSEEYGLVNKQVPQFHPGRQASIMIREDMIGIIGEVHPSSLRALDILQPVYFAELNLHHLFKYHQINKQVFELPQYPASTRDWTITCKEELMAGEIIACIKQFPSRLLQEVFVKTVYRSDKIGLNHKNITFNFVYRDDKKTVLFKTVESEHERITQQVLNNFNDLILA